MADSTPSDEMFKEAQVKTMLARSPMDGILRRWQSIGQGNVRMRYCMQYPDRR